MPFRFEYSQFPPKLHCVLSSSSRTPNIGNAPMFFSGDLKFDTGADITCIGASRLNLHCTEEEFTAWIQQNENIEIIKNGKIKKNGFIGAKTKGIDKEAEDIKAYAYQLDSFVIESADGNMSLGSVPVFITFDRRFQTPLLGRDLLSLLNIGIDNDNNIMTIDLSNKIKNNKISPLFLIQNGIYSKKSMLIEDNEIV